MSFSLHRYELYNVHKNNFQEVATKQLVDTVVLTRQAILQLLHKVSFHYYFRLSGKTIDRQGTIHYGINSLPAQAFPMTSKMVWCQLESSVEFIVSRERLDFICPYTVPFLIGQFTTFSIFLKSDFTPTTFKLIHTRKYYK